MLQFLLQTIYHILMFLFLMTALMPFHGFMILYEDFAFSPNNKWWFHLLMVLLSLFTFLLYVVALFAPTMYFFDYVEGSREARLTSLKLYFCTFLMIFFCCVTFAGFYVPGALVCKYLALHRFKRDWIMFGIETGISSVVYLFLLFHVIRKRCKSDLICNPKMRCETDEW